MPVEAEVAIGARNDKGVCSYGNCSNGMYPERCRRPANECGTTLAREGGYYAERLANDSRNVAGSSTLQHGMYDTCTSSIGQGCVLPPLRAPNGFVQYRANGDHFMNIETFGGVITLNRDACFYLDATFCSGALASAAESSAKARHRQPCAPLLPNPPTLPSHHHYPPLYRVRARRRVASATTSRR